MPHPAEHRPPLMVLMTRTVGCYRRASWQLTAACRVYRGVSGGILPEAFLVPNRYNVRGGIESAFRA